MRKSLGILFAIVLTGLACEARPVNVHEMMVGQTLTIKNYFTETTFTCVPRPEVQEEVDKLLFLNGKLQIQTLFPGEAPELGDRSDIYVRCGSNPAIEIEVRINCWMKKSEDYLATYFDHYEKLGLADIELDQRGKMRVKEEKAVDLEKKFCHPQGHNLDDITIDQSQPYALPAELKQSFEK